MEVGAEVSSVQLMATAQRICILSLFLLLTSVVVLVVVVLLAVVGTRSSAPTSVQRAAILLRCFLIGLRPYSGVE